jgi:hypothetical protein
MSTDMKTQQEERTKQILEEALRLAPEQRTTYLNSACGQDSELRAEVRQIKRPDLTAACILNLVFSARESLKLLIEHTQHVCCEFSSSSIVNHRLIHAYGFYA